MLPQSGDSLKNNNSQDCARTLCADILTGFSEQAAQHGMQPTRFVGAQRAADARVGRLWQATFQRMRDANNNDKS
jgi:hypothetical protein